jgi:hypothetical protein
MTTVVLSPLRKQGDVSKVLAAPTAVLLQGSNAPLTATIPRTQGSSTSPTATLACTQGPGTSLPDTLAHSYTPIVHLDPFLASIKGRSRAFMREGRAGERADEQAHSLSRTLVTPTTSAYPWRRITRATFSLLCSISRQPILAGTRSDNFTRRSRDPLGSKHRHNLIHIPLTICKKTLKRFSKRICENIHVVQKWSKMLNKRKKAIHSYLVIFSIGLTPSNLCTFINAN